MLRRIRRLYVKLARLWYKLVTLKSSPHKVALGFALGVFLSFTPTFGVQVLLAVSLAALFRLNPISAAIGVQVTNAFTVLPIYALCHRIGADILGSNPMSLPAGTEVDLVWWLHTLKTGSRWLVTELIGGLFVGTFTGVVAYFLMLWTVVRFRAARTELHLKRMSRRISEGEKPKAEE